MTATTARTSTAPASVAELAPPAIEPPPAASAGAVRWLETLGRKDVPAAGGKGANLGELIRSGLPVPPGFVVTVEGWRGFLETGNLRERIAEAMASAKPDDYRSLEAASQTIQRAIRELPVPADTAAAIAQAYRELSARTGAAQAYVAVRSSATMEDTGETSFAGMNRSFLGIRGERDLTDRVREVWASLYSPRVMFYRSRLDSPGEPEIAVIVQAMIDADAAGVAFSLDPASGDRSVIVIEAAFGLGEVVVSGEVEPDRYRVSRQANEITEVTIGLQRFKLARGGDGASARIDLSPQEADRRVLCEAQILAVADLVKRAERVFGSPQDTEWAYAGDRLYLVQSRPVTAAPPDLAPRPAVRAGADVPELVRGAGASPGVASGKVRICATPGEAANIAEGDILVTESTSPDWVPFMKRAAAIVTARGGITSHAAIVSRELGVPCVVGAGNALSALRDGMTVTVDGGSGRVTEGAAAPVPAPAQAERSLPEISARTITATRVMVNLAEPERAAEVAVVDSDGVGLLRGEFMLLSALDGVHPRRLLAEERGAEFADRMAASLRAFAAAFAPRPVIYRATDLRSNEFRQLAGCEAFEAVEANTMIGVRGAFRYAVDPSLFRLELDAVRRVFSEFRNLHLMLPFVRTPEELHRCLPPIADAGLTASRDFRLWIMAEVPSVVHYLPDYAALGVAGVSIGSNDLTQLVLGVDRDSETLAALFDERDPAVLAAIAAIVHAARGLGMETSICGQAPSTYAGYAEFLVGIGIDSISVSPDALAATRGLVAAAERRIVLEAARDGNRGGNRRFHRRHMRFSPVVHQ
ncbi:MAG: phosphoenolpyruvate synthase [Chloroflexota bacterium]